MIDITKIITGPVSDLLDKIVSDADERQQLKFEIESLAQKLNHQITLSQIDVNKTESLHRHIFIAGWRPFIGWVCGASLSFNYIIAPVMEAANLEVTPLDLTIMLPILLGLLGLRTAEKMKGVAR